MDKSHALNKASKKVSKNRAQSQTKLEKNTVIHSTSPERLRKESPKPENKSKETAPKTSNTIPKKQHQKKKAGCPSKTRQPTLKDHFAVRRSSRKCKSVLDNEKHCTVVSKLLSKEEDGLKAVDIEGKGRGIVATRFFAKGDFLCEYSGDLISEVEARKREAQYVINPSIGCYMYYFTFKGEKFCVDATNDNNRCGRLINHSRTAANAVTKVLSVDGQPYLYLVAATDVSPGDELQYDYGDHTRASVEAHPWLKL